MSERNIGMKKHLVLILLLIFAVSSLTAGAYNGVSEWAESEIELSQSNGVIPESLGEKNFSTAISREEFAELCVVLYERLTDSRAIMPEINPFLDTDNVAVTKAYELGVINGVTEITFEPYADVTREQAAAMLKRVIVKAGAETAAEETDVFTDDGEISEWAKADVYAMSAMGVIKGRDDGSFAPLDGVTIEEAVVISGRLFIELTAEPETDAPVTEVKLLDAVPAISFGEDRTVEETETSVTVTVSGATLADYNQYILDVQGYGYNDVENIFPDTFMIANNGINRIDVSFGNSVMKVVLTKIN